MLDAIVRHLRHLVAFDTRNPPRAIDGGGIFDYLQAHLPGFSFQLRDHGAGAVSLLAVRGAPHCLFNVHLDTVPDSPQWTRDPLQLVVEDGRAIGLGACDIKGAAAGLLVAASQSDGDAAFLFSSDEEANDARCVPAFLAENHGFHHAIVAEPSGCRALLAHRGIASAQIHFQGRAGHASSADALHANALHQAMRWGVRALDLVERHADDAFDGLQGLRLNIGKVEGGIKANVIAPSAHVYFNMRPLPSHDVEALHAQLRGFAPQDATYTPTFHGPPLPAGNAAQALRNRQRAQALADAWCLPVGTAVDFWTEASLFSQAGMAAIVYGPGDIAQAHTADEWVALEQLRIYTDSIIRILRGSAL